jgi:hypothetical protein
MITVTSFLGTQIVTGQDNIRSVKIDSMWVSGRAHAGDTATLRVLFHATDSGNVALNFKFPDEVYPLNRSAGEKHRMDTLNMPQDSTYLRSYQIKIGNVGYSHLVISLTHLNSDSYKENYDYKVLMIEHKVNWDTVVKSTDKYAIPFEYISELPQSNDKVKKEKLMDGEFYNVNISGKILTRESNDRLYGVPGVTVRIFFLGRDGYGRDWWYEKYFSYPSNVQDVTSLDGSYTFSGQVSLSNQNIALHKVKIFVGRWNHEASIINGVYHSINNGVEEGYFDVENINDFTISNVSLNLNWDITLPNEDINFGGRVLRHLYMASKFTENYHAKLPKVIVEIEDISAAGKMWPPVTTTEIKLDPVDGAPFFSTAAHEYGHYFHWETSGTGMILCGEPIREGWSNFFSFATRSWANKNYGDALEADRSNTEDGPFQYREYTKWFGSVGIEVKERYSGMSYRGDVQINGFACFLWNCYDGYNADNFEADIYGVGDNDDVDNLKGRIFNIFINQNPWTRDSWRSNMKSGLSIELQKSMDDLWLFCNDDRLKPMKPAQLKNLRGSWCAGSPTVLLQWKHQHYTPHTDEPDNWEIGYKVEYFNINLNAWQLVAQVPQNRSYAVAPAPSGIGVSLGCGDYRVTAFNAQGDSYIPQVITVCPHYCPPDNNLSNNTLQNNQ